MSAREVLINFFQLPSDEIIFQDYGCALSKGVLNHGRMFVCENYLCFLANILGIKTKVVIKFTEIIQIEKSTILGIIQNAIMIQTKDTKQYNFSSFTDRDSVFIFLNALWKGQPVNFVPEQDQEGQAKFDQNNSVESAEVEVSFLQSDGTDQDKQELMQANLPISVDKFFDLFVGNDAIFSILDHRKNRGDIDSTVSKWQLNEESGVTQRELNSVIKITDVPFRDRSRIYKLQTYKKEKYYWHRIDFYKKGCANHTIHDEDFRLEERWEVSPLENDPNKCQLRSFGWLVFLKSVYLKKTIQTRSIQSLKEDYEAHMNGIRLKLESMNSSRSPTADTQRYDDYEASKAMDDNLLEDTMKRTRSRSVEKQIERSLGPLSSQKNQRLQIMGIIMIVLLILIQILIICLLVKMIRTVETRLDSMETTLKSQQFSWQLEQKTFIPEDL